MSFCACGKFTANKDKCGVCRDEAEVSTIRAELADLRAKSEAAADANLELAEGHARVVRERDELLAALRSVLDRCTRYYCEASSPCAQCETARAAISNAEAKR